MILNLSIPGHLIFYNVLILSMQLGARHLRVQLLKYTSSTVVKGEEKTKTVIY